MRFQTHRENSGPSCSTEPAHPCRNGVSTEMLPVSSATVCLQHSSSPGNRLWERICTFLLPQVPHLPAHLHSPERIQNTNQAPKWVLSRINHQFSPSMHIKMDRETQRCKRNILQPLYQGIDPSLFQDITHQLSLDSGLYLSCLFQDCEEKTTDSRHRVCVLCLFCLQGLLWASGRDAERDYQCLSLRELSLETQC